MGNCCQIASSGCEHNSDDKAGPTRFYTALQHHDEQQSDYGQTLQPVSSFFFYTLSVRSAGSLMDVSSSGESIEEEEIDFALRNVSTSFPCDSVF